MNNKKESIYEKATGYYYYKEVAMTVNGAEEIIKVKKYRKPILSAQKKILKWEF